eukprot:14104661-Heterocapsa_arctica.AAC.1
MLRKAKPINRDYQQGDWVMYRVVQGARAPGSEWAGPARHRHGEGRRVASTRRSSVCICDASAEAVVNSRIASVQAPVPSDATGDAYAV